MLQTRESSVSGHDIAADSNLCQALEDEFYRRHYDGARRQIVTVLTILLFLTLLGLGMDGSIGILFLALMVKLMLLTPALLLGIVLALHSKLSAKQLWLAGGMPFPIMVASVAFLGTQIDPVMAGRYLTCAGLAALFSNIALPIRFGQAVALSIVNVGFLVGVPLTFGNPGEIASYIDVSLFMGAIALSTTALVRERERARKQAFLLTLRTEAQTLEYQDLVNELTHLAHHDPLTGAGNRRSFEIRYHAIWRTAALRREQVALILIDVDRFKLFNDTVGHDEGDRCLRAVAQAVARGAGCTIDDVARYGGEEFILVLQSTTGHTAEAIRQSVEALALPHPGLEPGGVVTVSVGKAFAQPGLDLNSPVELLRAADKALYEAKANGRNRVVVYGSTQMAA